MFWKYAVNLQENTNVFSCMGVLLGTKDPVFTIVLHGEFSQEISIIDTAQKMEFSINDFVSKCDQICSFLRIWSHFLKKSLMENFIICTVRYLTGSSIRLWDYTSTLYLFWGSFELRVSHFSKTYGYGHPEPYLGLSEKFRS